MRILRILLSLLVLASCSTGLFAQPRVGAWQMHEGKEGIVSFPTSDANSRKAAFGKGVVPQPNDAGWKSAQTNSDGTVNFSQRSLIANCNGQLDFTYFQASIFVPANVDVSTLTVSYDKADDGARIYFFNSKYLNGHYDEASDLIGGVGYKAVDLKDQVVKGEENRIVIVQYDQCPVQNNVQGIRVKVNGQEVKPAVLPDKFRLHAYSVGGKRAEKGSDYWMAFNPSEQGPRIPGRILSAKTGTVMEIEKENVGEGIVALKVANGPEAGSYLTVQDDNSVKVMKSPPTNQSTQFKVRPPEENGAASLNFVSFESAWRPNHFLRHEGFVLKVTPASDAERKNVVYRQDASWLFEPIK